MIFKICALGLIGAVSSYIIKSLGWRGAPLVAIGAVLAIYSFMGEHLLKIGELFNTLTGVDATVRGVKTVMKLLGIGYVSGISCEICREMGENSIAGAVELIGKLESFTLILPYIVDALEIGLGLAL